MYKRSIVTFVDILGFRDLVKNHTAGEVDKIIDAFRRVSGDPRRQGLRVVAFSDSVIRSRPASMRSGVFYELLDLLHAQGELIARGVLVRGGVSLGNIAWRRNKVFGPGFIDAYEMESKFAIYPRIAVSPVLLHEFRAGGLPYADHHDLAEEAGWIRSLLVEGDDGIWFIDYLRAFRSELDDPDSYPEYLYRHRTLILSLAESLASTNANLSSLALKANWLIKYHNTVVEELNGQWLDDLDVERDDLLVPDGTMPSIFSFAHILPTSPT